MPPDFVRGPLEPFPLDALRPFPDEETFETVTARGLGDLTPIDGVLGAAAAHAADHAPRDLDAVFHQTIGDAAQDGGDAALVLPASELVPSIEAGNNADLLRLASLPYLPGPDTVPQMQLDEPPQMERRDDPDDWRERKYPDEDRPPLE